jgi:hypothetical protein
MYRCLDDCPINKDRRPGFAPTLPKVDVTVKRRFCVKANNFRRLRTVGDEAKITSRFVLVAAGKSE